MHLLTHIDVDQRSGAARLSRATPGLADGSRPSRTTPRLAGTQHTILLPHPTAGSLRPASAQGGIAAVWTGSSGRRARLHRLPGHGQDEIKQ